MLRPGVVTFIDVEEAKNFFTCQAATVVNSLIEHLQNCGSDTWVLDGAKLATHEAERAVIKRFQDVRDYMIDSLLHMCEFREAEYGRIMNRIYAFPVHPLIHAAAAHMGPAIDPLALPYGPLTSLHLYSHLLKACLPSNEQKEEREDDGEVSESYLHKNTDAILAALDPLRRSADGASRLVCTPYALCACCSLVPSHPMGTTPLAMPLSGNWGRSLCRHPPPPPPPPSLCLKMCMQSRL